MINGNANVRKSVWDIHIVEEGQLEPTNITASARVLTKPTADRTSISDFNLSKMDEVCYNNYKFLQILNYSKKELDNCIGDKDMEKFKDEIERVNSDSEFIQLMSADKEEEMYLNTVKHLEYEKGVEQNKTEIAKKMLESNIAPEDIAKYTGLSKEEIEKLKEAN